jgi:hypothetical protein
MIRWFLDNFINPPLVKVPERAPRSVVQPVEDEHGDYTLSFEKYAEEECRKPELKYARLPVPRSSPDRVRLLSFHPDIQRPPIVDGPVEKIKLEPAAFTDTDMHIPFHHGLYANPRFSESNAETYSGWFKHVRRKDDTSDRKKNYD